MGNPETVVMGNPTFCCAGLFITWWGYLAMNSASTLGVEGTRWLQSAKGTVLTMITSFGGGSMGLFLNYMFFGGHTIHVGKMVTTVMGSLVSYGAITFLCTPTETIIIGMIAALIVFFGLLFLDANHNIDDPCCTFLGDDEKLKSETSQIQSLILKFMAFVASGEWLLLESLARRMSSLKDFPSMPMMASSMGITVSISSEFSLLLQ